MFAGNYNEAESAASFQQALAAWRCGKSEGGEPASETPRQPQVLKVETPREFTCLYYCTNITIHIPELPVVYAGKDFISLLVRNLTYITIHISEKL